MCSSDGERKIRNQRKDDACRRKAEAFEVRRKLHASDVGAHVMRPVAFIEVAHAESLNVKGNDASAIMRSIKSQTTQNAAWRLL